MLVNSVLCFSSRTAPQPLAYIIAGIRMARPLNCAMSAFAVLLGAWTVTRQVSISVLLCGMIWAALTTAGGNTLNDHFDADGDRLNHPRRVIPSGKISLKTALCIAWIELAVGAIAGFSIGLLPGSIALLSVFLLIGYEIAGLKNAGLPGNFIIALLTALLFLFGGTIAANPMRSVSLAILTFIASLGREIIKDIEDIPGDVSRSTWPMRVGTHRAGIAAAFLLCLTVVLSPAPYLLGIVTVWYLPIIVFADLIFLATIFLLFHPIWNASRTAKLAMIAVLAAIFIGI
jgi:geranylgeranylglycerol-phosphate geranylgeranyltransferase